MSIKGNPKCQLCDLHKTAQSVCLMGRGPVPSKVVIVGEAPGLREDDVGKPFQGRAGQLLDKILGRAGLKREDIYITNTVKCRPPDNRTPSGAEVKACRSYLDKELSKVKPEYVILLGASALKGVIKQTGIAEKHGQVIDVGGVKYLPTYHPAAALYDPKRLGPIEQDFKKFAAIVKGKELTKPKLRITEIVDRVTYKACIKAIRRSQWVSYDTETSGLDPRADNACVKTLQIGTKDGEFVLPLEVDWSVWKGGKAIQKNMLRGIVEALGGKQVVAQNGKFDLIFIHECYGLWFPLTFDTNVAAHLLDENEPTGLKYRARVDLGAHDYDIETDKKKGIGVTKEEFIEYGCYDAYYTRKLGMLYHKRLAETDGLSELFYWLMMPATRALARIETRGFYINRKRQAQVRAELQAKITDLQKKLKKFGDINWGSPAQVGELLFGKFKLTPLEYTPGGSPSTSESVMMRLADRHPAPRILLELRENQKLLSTYVGGHDEKGEPFGWEALMHGDYLYVSFKLTGTVTGRLSSRLHQVPRNKTIRSLIDAPDGWVFWSADFSQIELRLAAWFSGDPVMLQIYQDGGDIHLATAMKVLGVAADKITDEQRKMAKAVNFGLVYGMMAKKLVIYSRDNYGIDMTLAAAETFRRRFFEQFARLLTWHDRMKRLVAAEGQVRNPVGRIRRLPDIASGDWGRKAEAERQAVNSPVQGMGSDLKLMAMVELEEKFDEKECFLLGEHHDALLGLVRADKVDKWMTVVNKTMQHPALLEKFNIKVPVPIEVGIELGPWGTKNKWKPKEKTRG